MRGLAQRHIEAAWRTAFTLSMNHLGHAVQEKWSREVQHNESLDDYFAISGDDLARLTRGPR